MKLAYTTLFYIYFLRFVSDGADWDFMWWWIIADFVSLSTKQTLFYRILSALLVCCISVLFFSLKISTLALSSLAELPIFVGGRCNILQRIVIGFHPCSWYVITRRQRWWTRKYWISTNDMPGNGHTALLVFGDLKCCCWCQYKSIVCCLYFQSQKWYSYWQMEITSRNRFTQQKHNFCHFWLLARCTSELVSMM